MRLLIIIIIIFLGSSCQHKEYKVVYEINYPHKIYKDSLTTYSSSEFSVDYYDNTYAILGDGIYILKRDKYPIFIKKVQELN